MKLSEIKNLLPQLNTVIFELPDGTQVPKHFHVTEVGLITKHFIDCGGTVRKESVVNFQLWSANDVDHRLHADKLAKIIALSEKVIGLEDLEIEVEYQSDTIGKYGLEYHDTHFFLTQKQTNCLAKDNCGIPTDQLNQVLPELKASTTCCTPGGGCC